MPVEAIERANALRKQINKIGRAGLLLDSLVRHTFNFSWGSGASNPDNKRKQYREMILQSLEGYKSSMDPSLRVALDDLKDLFPEPVHMPLGPGLTLEIKVPEFLDRFQREFNLTERALL